MPSYPNSSAINSGIQAQVNFMTELTRKTVDSVRKLSELNMQFAQQVMQDSAKATRQLASCTDPFQFAATAVNAARPAMQHLQSYQQQLLGVLSGAQVDLTRRAEALLPEGARYATAALVQSMTTETDATSDAFSSASYTDGGSSDGSGGASIH